MGEDSGAFRDLNLAFVEVSGRPFAAMDLVNYFRDREGPHPILHNADLLWPTIAYLCTFLHRRGFTTDFVNAPHLHWDLFRSKLREQQVLAVAITTTLIVSAEPVVALVEFIRRHNAQAKIIVGGPFIYNQSQMLEEQQLQELFAFIGADIYVINQMGEQALADVLSALKEGRPLGQVANVAFRRSSLAAQEAILARRRPQTGSSFVGLGELTGERQDKVAQARAWAEAHPERAAELVRRLREAAAERAGGSSFVLTAAAEEDNPLLENRIDYSLFPRAEIGEFVSLWTSKSCPYACTFCGFPERAGAYTVLPVNVLERELEELAGMGIRNLTFLDDTFNVPRARFKELLRMMIRRGFGFRWNSFYRGDQGDAETVALMAEAGCEGVFLGVESGSDRMLERMNKTARRAHYVQAIAELKRAGILTHANFIVGFPGETRETVEESIRLIEETGPDTYRAQLWYADPLTPVWRQRHELGIQGSSFQWKHATMDSHEAADLVDRMFVCVENSTWLPQHSFEQWSMLYLRRHGMDAAHILRYMRCFNAAVKEKLIYGGARPASAALVEGMAAAVRSGGGDPVPAAEEMVEAYSAARYLAAERWAWKEFARAPGPMKKAAGEANWDAVEIAGCDAGFGDVLGAFGEALTAWLGEDIALLVAREGGVGAIRLDSGWRDRAAEKISTALLHGALGLHVVTNPWRMKPGGATAPALEAALVWGTAAAEALRDQPKLLAGLRLILEAGAGGWNLRYDTAAIGAAQARRLLAEVAEALPGRQLAGRA
jgi:radical SAM superfamily enzyme YgiQ (UPF0313 family)